MKSSDLKLLQTKITGSTLTAADYQEVIDLINFFLQFAGTTGTEFLTMGLNAQTNIGAEEGSRIVNEQGGPDYGYSNGPDQMAIGAGAKAWGWKCVAIGQNSWAGNLSATAIGQNCIAAATHCTAIGRGAVAYLQNSLVFGTRNSKDFWIGSHQGLAYDIKDTDGNDAFMDAPITDWVNHEVRLRGADGKDWRLTPILVNKDGGSTAICGGIATGTGQSGEVRFKTAPNSTVSSNNLNTLIDAGKFDAAKNVDTRFILLDVTDGTYKRVEFGADDSAGAGFKILKVAN